MRTRLVLSLFVGAVALVLASGVVGGAGFWLWWVVFGAGMLGGSFIPAPPPLPPTEKANLSAGQFRRAVNLGAFVDKTLRDRVAEAMRLWQDCETMAESSGKAGLGRYFDDRLACVRSSVQEVYQMAVQLNSYRRHPVSASELSFLTEEIETLEKRIAGTTDSQIIVDLEHRLKGKRTLLSSQQSLVSVMDRAGCQLDNSVALLKALTAQMRMTLIVGNDYVGGTKGVVEELNSEVEALRQIQQVLNGCELPSSSSRELPPMPPPGKPAS